MGLMQEITQLKETITAKDAEIAAKDTTPVEEEGPTKDELKEQLATVKAELQGRTDTTDELKLKNNNASQDEVLKSQQENVQLKEENANIKNVLIETESMLCRLQTGVDAEVQKWQAKVTEKDAELEAQKKSTDDLKTILSKHGYDLTTLESSLNDGQRQLMAEKEENTKKKKKKNFLNGKNPSKKKKKKKKKK